MMTQEAYEQQSRFFAALSHPVRLRILDILTQGEACVCHFSAVLGQRQAYISQQLAALKEAGLIIDKKEGLYVYYRLANADIAQVLREVRLYLASVTGDESLLPSGAPVYSRSDCPCPKCQAEEKQKAGS